MIIFDKVNRPVRLSDFSKVVVVGGGPAGAFFTIQLLKKARHFSKKVDISIIERKREPLFYQPARPKSCREGCNYCAGGISPKLADVLSMLGLGLPDDVVVGHVETLMLQGTWKHIELRIPEGRKMFSVFRGSRPGTRTDRYSSFDSFLLDAAIREGARLLTGNVTDVRHNEAGKIVVTYSRQAQPARTYLENLEADFVVFACGVNQIPGMSLPSNQLFKSFSLLAPSFKPPRVRKTLIVELEGREDIINPHKGELYFVDYGSKDLLIEMSSLMPKGRYITAVLIGPTIDRSDPMEHLDIIKSFLDLPHVKRIIPGSSKLIPVCVCCPNMTVGAAHHAFGCRFAAVGDIAVSRLYKDGIYSAYMTASGLADSILNFGIDKKSLKKAYWPVVRKFKIDNWFGRIVFALNRTAFSRPILSRVLYQAVLTERKTKFRHKRPLESILWKIASGDDSYSNIILAMLHPVNIILILVGGVFITGRNYLVERLLGLNWRNVGRYPTGTYREDLSAKRTELKNALALHFLERRPDFEKMYSIKIRAELGKIMNQLGKFGEPDCTYFTSSMIRVRKISGRGNEIGCIIIYRTPFKNLDFSIALEKIIAGRYLIYRVKDGFAQGGVLIFDLGRAESGIRLLSIYVAFNFHRSRYIVQSVAWYILGLVFPHFVHDVLWNHALCRLKDVAESESD